MQAAELLIKQGMADIEAEDDTGRTAMSHAAKHGSVDCLNLLGKEHADVFHKDHEGKTPLQIAEVSSRHEVVTALKKLQQVNSKIVPVLFNLTCQTFATADWSSSIKLSMLCVCSSRQCA